MLSGNTNDNTIFNFIVSNYTRFKRISVTKNIVTFYMHNANTKEDDIRSFIANNLVDQTRKICSDFIGKNFYRNRKFGELHELLHQDDAYRNLSHAHHITCDLVTPERLQSLLSDILKLQKNQTAKMLHILSLNMDWEDAKNKALRENKPIPSQLTTTIHDLNKMDYISRNDTRRMLAEFKKFYTEHENQIIKEYRNHKIRFNLETVSLDLDKNLSAAFYHVFLVTVLETFLIHSGVSRNNARNIAFGMQLLLMAMTLETLPAFLVANLLLLSLKKLNLSTALSLSIGVLNMSIISGLAEGTDLIKAITYVGGTTVASFVARKMSHGLFPVPQQNNNNQNNNPEPIIQNQMGM